MLVKQCIKGRPIIRQLFQKILIANRGEIACRIIKTCKRLGVKTVAVFSDADSQSQHVRLADEAYWVGASPSTQSYLNTTNLVEIIRQSGAQAVHPGYGFLSENYKFVQELMESKIVFIGPPVHAIKAMGSKSESKKIMIKSSVPVIPGYNGDNQHTDFLEQEARKIGFPVMIKAVLGGGGKGMRIVRSEREFLEKLESAKNEALKSFKDDGVILEKFITNPRHIEVQVFSDTHENAVYLFERDCSSQRRHQKIVEEAPSPCLDEETRRKIGESAVKAARAVGYVGAGTVEFILDQDSGKYYFLEMNTRLQVEHPITEMITGQDLVEWQIRVASGEKLPLLQDQIERKGHSIEARIYAEDPARNFTPDAGKLIRLAFPRPDDTTYRFETGVQEGDTVSTFYDPMIAKVVVHGQDRTDAIGRLQSVLSNLEIAGVASNIEFVRMLLKDTMFIKGNLNANYIDEHHAKIMPKAMDVRHIVILGVAHALAKNLAQSVWGSVEAQRLGSMSLTVDDTVYSVQMVGSGREWELIINGQASRLKLLPRTREGNIEVLIDNQYMKAVASEHASGLDIFVRGFKYAIRVATGQSSSQASGPGEGLVRSSMPSRIASVHVKTGDRVKLGDRLLVTEAMKMEHVVKANLDGTVERVHCREGQLVGGGQLLVEIAGNKQK